jgi:hypothetical protein
LNFKIIHDGNNFRIYYFPIKSFEKDMTELGEFLELVENDEGTVSSIIPNTGNPTVSIALGKSRGGMSPKSRDLA